MKIELRINGRIISVVNIPVDNPDYKPDNYDIDRSFKEWLDSYFGVGV
ncbi:MAG: hypothetical protein WC479_09225 [Candidatus Izemoplasmatales bacterium]